MDSCVTGSPEERIWGDGRAGGAGDGGNCQVKWVGDEREYNVISKSEAISRYLKQPRSYDYQKLGFG